jgi:hypothetical protein
MYCMYAHVCCMYDMYWPRQARMPAQRPQKTPRWGAFRGPHSGHPWAGGRPLFSAIGHPTPDQFWRTCARSTRGGVQSAPPAQPIDIPHAFCTRRARPEGPSPSEMTWIGGSAQVNRVQPPVQHKNHSRH